jgi:ABC-2 type transport system permease protein
MVMSNGSQNIQVALPEDLETGAIQRTVDSALKRFSTGFLKTVAVWVPPANPPMSPYDRRDPKRQFRQLQHYLGEDFNVITTDLKNGQVPQNADILMVLAPEDLDTKQLFAIDQFIMQGGSVIVSTSPFDIKMEGALGIRKVHSGLEKWLEHQGISIENRLALDPQNTPFPVPERRNIGGFTVQETKMVNYPYFIDIRPNGMDSKSGVLSGIRQLSFSWASPVTIDNGGKKDQKITALLRSTKESWSTDDLDIQPNFNRYGDIGFPVGEKQNSATLAVMVEGGFSSWFKDKPSPLAAAKDKKADDTKDKKPEKQQITPNRVIDHSPDSSRLFVFASNTFLSDIALNLTSGVNGSSYEAPMQMMANCIDWSLEDRGLLSMRSQTRFSRTLAPLRTEERRLIEYLNYGLAIAGLLLIWAVGLIIRRRTQVRYQAILDSGRNLS